MKVIVILNNENSQIALNCQSMSISYVDKPIVYLSQARCLNIKDKKSRKFFFVNIQTEFKPFKFSLILEDHHKNIKLS